MNERGNTTKIIVEHANDYFGAYLDNGGIRVGLLNTFSIDFLSDHADYTKVKVAAETYSADDFEQFVDKVYSGDRGDNL